MSSYDEAIERLALLTRSGDVTWRKGDTAVCPAYPVFQGDNIVGFPYFATVGDHHLAIYESSVPTMNEDGGVHVRSVVRVEQVARDGRLEYAWPIEGDMWRPAADLLREVRRKTSGAADVVAAILSMTPGAKKGG